MPFTSNTELKAALADQLARGDLTTQIPDFITLFECDANRELFRMRLTETSAILVPTAPAALTITNAADNGSGLIRLTMASTSTLATGSIAGVSDVGGTTEANGSWVITVIAGTTVDLVGSTFTNAYASGGSIQLPQGQCSLPADYMGWRRVTWTGSARRELEYTHPAMLQAYYPSTPADLPTMFTIEGSTLKVRPVNGTGLEFDYFAKPAALSTSLNWLMTNHSDCYFCGALEQAYLWVKDTEQAAPWAVKKSAIYSSIKMQRFREDGALAIRVMGQTP